jgi:hypothetical protein
MTSSPGLTSAMQAATNDPVDPTLTITSPSASHGTLL